MFKKRFSTNFFVFVSVLGTVFFFLFISIIPVFLSYLTPETKSDDNVMRNYYDYSNPDEDMFITRNPNLRKKITEPVIDANDPSLGPEDAKVTIVEYSDFDCEFCGEQERRVRDLLKGEFQGKVRLVRKDFPETDKQSASWKAARAGRCAQEQDKYWQYHHLLYTTDRGLNKSSFLDLARQAGLNFSQFRDCYQEGRQDYLIKLNLQEGSDLGIPGIPYFYINDQEVLGEVSKEELKRMIEAEIR